DRKGAVLVLKGPRFRVTSKAIRMRFRQVSIGAVENARIETHKAHWPEPNFLVALSGFVALFFGVFGIGTVFSIYFGYIALGLGSLNLRQSPRPFAVADIGGKPTLLLKCANEGEAKLVVMAIREAQRIAQGGEVVDG
ncbi:MAG: hypothetical protein AAFR74_03760, partial [Pseudomonadota bacterium]